MPLDQSQKRSLNRTKGCEFQIVDKLLLGYKRYKRHNRGDIKRDSVKIQP